MRRCTVLILLLICISACSHNQNGCLAQRSGRDAWQQPEKIMDNVGVKPGMVIGEAGAGSGYFTFHLARRVGSIRDECLPMISKRVSSIKINRKCEEQGVKNITTILGKEADPLFPPDRLDMVIMMKAFHHFDEPAEWMKNVIPSMKPGAPMVIVDVDPERSGDSKDHFMTRERLLAAMADTDFKLERVETFLEKDNIYVFRLEN